MFRLSLPRFRPNQFSVIPNRLKRSINPMSNAIVDSYNLLNNPLAGQARMLKRRQFLPLAGSIVGGTLGEVGGDAVSRGIRVARRAGGGLKRKSIGFVRGVRTGVKANIPKIADTFTGNAFTAGSLSKNLLENSPIANTKVGRTLLTPVSNFVPNKIKRLNPMRSVKVKKLIRNTTAGVFKDNPYLTNFIT